MKNKETEKIKFRKLTKSEEKKIKEMPIIVEKLSEKTSDLISQIGNLTVKIQYLEREIENLNERIEMYKGHIREKENKINMIRKIIGK